MKSSFESKIFNTNQTLNVRGRLIDLTIPKVMGILNVTPDSFYDGGRYDSEVAIMAQVEKMIEDGTTFIDVGGYSSRPGAEDITIEEEITRVSRAIKLIVKKFPEVILSIDTFRSQVASAAIKEGAAMINDISGGEQDKAMLEIAATQKVPYVMMHMRGNPQTMNQFTTYENLLKDVIDYFHGKIYQLREYGIKDIVIDPGFGFAKTAQQNFELLNALDYFKILSKPILVGLSRKSMVWKTLTTTAEHALNGTSCLNTIALLKGANILRVHDVKEAVEIVKLVHSTTAPA
jgi:dihydropteroate synthase